MTERITDAANATALMRHQADHLGARRAVGLVADPPAAAAGWANAELGARARGVAAWLAERGSPGDRVLLLFPSGLDFAGAFFGCLYAGMVAVPAPVPDSNTYARRRLRGIAENTAVSFVLTDRASAPVVLPWVAESTPGTSVLTVDADPLGDPDAWAAPHIDHGTVALLQYTSGSTAVSKGVVISHGNLLHNVETITRALHIGPVSDTGIGGWIPNHHDMGLMGHLLTPLFSGNWSVLTSPSAFVRRPESWLRLIDRFDVAVSAAPSFAYELAARRVSEEVAAELDLSRWRWAMNGSEPVRASVLAAFAARFGPSGFRPEAMVPCFGMAEATLFVSGSSDRAPVVRRVDQADLERHVLTPAVDGMPHREVVSCGVPQGVEARVVDPATRRVLPEGAVGELWLRGPAVARGYWRNPEATGATFDQSTEDGETGFLRTGDLAVLVDGELHITGRLKEVLIIRGRNLYPQDVEHELRAEHSALASTVGAVFCVRDDARDDERLVVLHEYRGKATADELAGLAAGMRKTVASRFGVFA
ncbi:fatty acyl-AMP ligase, partial [Saccharothrix sp. MB29]|nr:fatty acyl-AMP ligase [Saccharothrix sp. MB29]